MNYFNKKTIQNKRIRSIYKYLIASIEYRKEDYIQLRMTYINQSID